jgi:hypothetical protein
MANATKSKSSGTENTDTQESEVAAVTTEGETKKVETEGAEHSTAVVVAEQKPVEPKNPALVKKAVALGKEMMKKDEAKKADAARKMYELIHEEPREIIVKAFIEGASLTPKGAQTYFYNCKRKKVKGS